MIPTDRQQRKECPMFRGLIKYFPDALAAVARVSYVGNQQHNPGEELHWARGKSTDHADCIIRHMAEAGQLDEDGLPHTAKVAWRALAMLQLEMEARAGTDVFGPEQIPYLVWDDGPMSPNAGDCIPCADPGDDCCGAPGGACTKRDRGFKVGDWVRVNKPEAEHEGPGWVGGMDQYDGHIFRIADIGCPADSSWVELAEIGDRESEVDVYWFDTRWLTDVGGGE